MKFIIAIALLVVAAQAFPQQQGAEIVSFTNENDGEGTYSFAFETSDGTSRRESGNLARAGTDESAIQVQGAYGHKTPEGKTVSVEYTANENGYKPRVVIS